MLLMASTYNTIIFLQILYYRKQGKIKKEKEI